MARREPSDQLKGEGGGIDWDEVVDVICVGSGPGVLAYGLCCRAADLDVLFLDSPIVADAGLTDFLAAMTDDLDGSSAESEIAVGRADPAPVASDGGTLEPFVGEHLRQWSARCLASPSGVLFTQVPDVLVPMVDGDGHTITTAVLGTGRITLLEWLRDEAPSAQERLEALVFDEGRIAGVRLDDGSTVGAAGGVAFAVGPAVPDWLTDIDGDLDVAVVGRPAGRFARIELFRR